jgi:protoporphyrinogen oxidase
LKKKVVILGGGISGLTSSYVLLKKGYDTVVLEKNTYLGGLSATFSHNDNLLDFGPHNLHTSKQYVLDFVKDELNIPLKRIPIYTSKLLFMGKLIDYPLKIHNAIRNLKVSTAIETFYDYFVNRVLIKLGLKHSVDDSFESWVVNRFGKKLYDLYFGPYIRKVWGISGKELDLTVAVKRIPEPSLFALVMRTITGIKFGKKHSEDPSLIKSYYPPKGIGMIAESLKKRIMDMGGKIELEAETKEISVHDKNITYTTKTGNNKIQWDYLINTAPLNAVVPLIKDRSDSVSKNADSLTYRSIILLYVTTFSEKVFDYPWIYFNDMDNKDLIFNRIYEISNFSKEMIKPGKGIICIEITCYKDGELWKESDEGLFEKCISYLDEHKFLKRANVESYFTKRLEVAYPVFKKGYRIALSEILSWLSKNKIFGIGRQGIFSYANVDHCIDMGLKLEQLFMEDNPDTEKYLNIYDPYIN